jgi:hypothetical protein
MFDGKLGIWPLTEEYVAQRASINRPRGAVLTRNIASVDREVIKQLLLKEVIPAIKSKWPARDRKKPILIQLDNAKPHVPVDDPDIVAAGTADGWNIHLFLQPENSPDLNVLDLGFFASIQAIQIEKPIYGIDALIAAVVAAYENLHYTTLDDIFLSLQNVMICILRADGANEYTLPHMGKQRLRRLGELPEVLTCPQDVFDRACDFIGGDPFIESRTCSS